MISRIAPYPVPWVYLVGLAGPENEQVKAFAKTRHARVVICSRPVEIGPVASASGPLCVVASVTFTVDDFALLDAEAQTGVPVVYLTHRRDKVEHCVALFQRGAFDLLVIPASKKLLADAISGAWVQHQDWQRADAASAALRTSFAKLTTRESHVLDYLLQGWSNAAIGAELAISVRTVKAHRKAILSKTGVQSLVQLVRAGGVNASKESSSPRRYHYSLFSRRTTACLERSSDEQTVLSWMRSVTANPVCFNGPALAGSDATDHAEVSDA